MAKIYAYLFSMAYSLTLQDCAWHKASKTPLSQDEGGAEEKAEY